MLVLSSFTHQAKANTLDSLQKGQKSQVDRKERFETQFQIGTYYLQENKFDSAIFAYKRSLEISPKNDFALQAKALDAIADANMYNEQILEAATYYDLAIIAYKKADSDPAALADCYMHYGRSYYGQAQYDSAMTYYMEAKKIFDQEEIKTPQYGYLLHYIGSVFKRQKQMQEACEYYHLEIEFGKENEYDEVYAEGLYLAADCIDDPKEQLAQNIKAFRIYEQKGNERMMGLMYGNVALSYQDYGMLDSAFVWQKKALELKRKAGSQSSISGSLTQIGNLLVVMKNYSAAIPYFREAEELAQQVELKRYIRLEEVYFGFYNLHYQTKNYREACEYLQLHYLYKDSSQSLNHQNEIREMELAYQTEKNEAEIELLKRDNSLKEKEKKVAEMEANSESRAKKLFLIAGIVVLLLGILALFKFLESQKRKKIIEYQKVVVEEKNKDITDSIVYASTIQQAIIRSQDNIREMFKDFFVFYKARDIVSGDFYWAHETEDGKKLVVVADCTGHGVPGAMMSMLGSAFLNEIVIERKERAPDQILNRMREQVKRALDKEGTNDGMDMAVCCIEGDTMTFAGANLPLYVLRENEIHVLKGNKQPVGNFASEEKPFESQEMFVQKGDLVYLFSDGFADQFGGPKGKKYKYQTLRKKLLDICSNSLSDQGKLLRSEFEMWKGDMEQVDDVCMLGFKV